VNPQHPLLVVNSSFLAVRILAFVRRVCALLIMLHAHASSVGSNAHGAVIVIKVGLNNLYMYGSPLAAVASSSNGGHADGSQGHGRQRAANGERRVRLSNAREATADVTVARVLNRCGEIGRSSCEVSGQEGNATGGVPKRGRR